MKILAIDTETSGLPQKGKPIAYQPHVIQLAASLIDTRGCARVYYALEDRAKSDE